MALTRRSVERPEPSEPDRVFEAVLSSAPVCQLRRLLRRVDATIDSRPLLTKCLPGSLLRLVFPVHNETFEEGTVVAAVCLYDLAAGRILYAHPMHAGAEVSPLLKHFLGPMASPSAQAGSNGDRATLRMIEHKRALWERFCSERLTLGHADAAARWRRDYYWALKRLYFCARCTPCRWGSESYERTAAEIPPLPFGEQREGLRLIMPQEQAEVVRNIVTGEAFRTETAYAARGNFDVDPHPRILKVSYDGHAHVLFPTHVRDLEAGSLVALAVTFHCQSREVLHAQCLSAGAEAEILYMRSLSAFGLPAPRPDSLGTDALLDYASWRRKAWSDFWLDELDFGIKIATARWLAAFWAAMEALFGGNDLCGVPTDAVESSSKTSPRSAWSGHDHLAV